MIHAQNLTKRYGDTLAVDDLSFSVEPGRVTGFLGPNGAGKSTTMRMVLGLDAPKVAGSSNTLVPVAKARLSLRIAPGDTVANAKAALERHLETHIPWGAELTITPIDVGEPTVIGNLSAAKPDELMFLILTVRRAE